MITIDYCGYHTHNPDCERIYRPMGTPSYLFLLILAPMTFHFPGCSPLKASPGACILYTPGYCQDYQADREFYNSYVHFSCDEDLAEQYNLKKNELFYPSNTEELHWLLKKIYQEFFSRLDRSETMTELYVRQLLILLCRGQSLETYPAEQHQNIYPELLALRSQMLSQCEQEWTIDRLCAILRIGKSQLYKYYDQFFHCSPKEELIQARLQKARYLLTNEAVTIKQAAYESGFQNICYFNRIFRRECGCTPGEYRQTISADCMELELSPGPPPAAPPVM